MFYFSLFMIILFLICCIVFALSIVFAKKVKMSREKASPFECGFDPNSNLRLPFSLRFFLITVIFLIFDVEIAILLPATVAIPSCNTTYWTMTSMFFLIILLLGLFHEWNQGALEWAT